MPELGPLGSVRGALSNEWPYRDLLCAGSKLSGFKVRLGAMLGSIQEWFRGAQTSQKIAHFLLDFVCKQSVSGG